MNDETIMRARHLHVLSGSQYLLKDINWEVKQGEHWVVFGCNGCGKTTLLSVIAGYKGFTTGALEVFGTNYTETNILQMRQKIGWVSSSFFDRYYRRERAIDIVLAGLSGTLGLAQNINDQQVIQAKNLLKDLGIGDKIHTPYDLLSNGERQQVLIARAFLIKPQLLILDEPATGLDVLARERLLAIIDRLAAQKEMTMIYVTHYPEEVLPVFTHCLLLRSGTVFAQGTTDTLFSSTVLSTFFNCPIETNYHERYTFAIPQAIKGGITLG